MDSSSENVERFIRLLAAQERRLNAYILTIVPNWTDAEGLAQEVKARLWQQYADFDSTKDFDVWSWAVVYYFVLTYRQTQGSRPRVLAGDVLEALSEQVMARSEDLDARHEALSVGLKKLERTRRELVMRWYPGQDTSRQIAESLGQSFEAVRKRILRIRNQLAECVSRTLRLEAGQGLGNCGTKLANLPNGRCTAICRLRNLLGWSRSSARTRKCGSATWPCRHRHSSSPTLANQPRRTRNSRKVVTE